MASSAQFNVMFTHTKWFDKLKKRNNYDMEYFLCVLERGKAYISRQFKVNESISNIRSNVLFFSAF